MAQPTQQVQDDVIVFSKFNGMSTQSVRQDLQEDKAAWMENLQPIGDNNVLCVPAQKSAIHTISGKTIVKTFYFQFGQSVDYEISFTSDGGGYATINPTGTTSQFAANGTFSAAGPDCTQWGTERILIADSTAGYCTWDTHAFVKYGGVSPNIAITAGGSGYVAPTVAITTSGSGTGATGTVQFSGGVVTGITLTAAGTGYATGDTVTFTINDASGTSATATGHVWPNSPNPKPTTLAVGFGRVWLAQTNVMTYTGTLGYDNFATANASGSTTIQDADLSHAIEALRFLNNYLFIFGDSSIRSIGSISVSGTVTNFTMTTLSSDQGTTFRDTILSYNKLLLFANTVGVFAVFGNSVEKISDDMDGIFRNTDFTVIPTASLNDINNIRCYLLLVRYNDPNASARGLILAFMNKKWFVINMDKADGSSPLSIINTALQSGVYNTLATNGTDIIPILADATVQVPILLSTSLSSHGTPMMGKRMGRFAVAQTANNQSSLTITLESERFPSQDVNYNLSNVLNFVSDAGGQIQFQNNSGANLNFVAGESGFFYQTGKSNGVAGTYLGATLSGHAISFTLNSIMLEYEFSQAFTSMKNASPTVLSA